MAALDGSRISPETGLALLKPVEGRVRLAEVVAVQRKLESAEQRAQDSARSLSPARRQS